MVKVQIKKKLASLTSKIYGLEKDDAIPTDKFIPIYFVYVDDKLEGRYLNIYEAAREAERFMDLNTIEMAYEEHGPAIFRATIVPNDLNNIVKH